MAILVVYWSAIDGDFISLDDYTQIVRNPLIRDFSLSGILDIFGESKLLGAYIPVTVLSWSVDYFLHELDSEVFHLTNILLHCLNTILLFRLTRLISGSSITSVAIATVFAVHPMNVEVVVWASARKDLLYTFFLLVSFSSYHNYVIQKSSKWLTLAFAAFVLAVLSKAVAVVFPVWLLLADKLLYGRKPLKAILKEKAAFFVFSGLIGSFAVYSSWENVADAEPSTQRWYEYMLAMMNTYTMIAVKFFAPLELSAYHPRLTLKDLTVLRICYISMVPMALVLFGFLIRKNRIALFGLLFFVVGILPVSQIVPFGISAYAERFGYMSTIGISIVLAALISQWGLMKKSVVKSIGAGLLACVLVLFGTRSFSYSKVWKNNLVFWHHIVESYPDDQFPYYNLGLHYAVMGESDLAIQNFSKSISIATTASALNNRGMRYLSLGKIDLAKADFFAAIQKDPKFGLPYMNLGVAYLSQQEYQKALTNLLEAERLGMKEDFRVYYNLAIAHEGLGQDPQAIQVLGLALNLNQDFSPALYKRARLMALRSNFEPAIADIEKGLALDSNNVDFIVLRSEIRFSMQQYRLALEDAFTSIKLGYPINAEYLNELKLKAGYPSIEKPTNE